MKIPESVHGGLKLAGEISACAGGVIAVFTAIIGAAKSTKSRKEISNLIVGEILDKNPDITAKDVKSVVISGLKSSDYWKSLDYAEKGLVTEMVTKDLRNRIDRKEARVC